MGQEMVQQKIMVISTREIIRTEKEIPVIQMESRIAMGIIQEEKQVGY